MRTLQTLAAISAFTFSLPIHPAFADELKVAASPAHILSPSETQQLISAVSKASSVWIEAFNRSDAAGAAEQYAENATMTVKPFGRFSGRSEIQAFWENIIGGGFKDVEYILPKIEVVDSRSAVISAGWRMNKAFGIITKELWVIQDDGRALLVEDEFEILITR